MKKVMTLALMLLLAVTGNAQMADPVNFSAQLKTGATADAEIIFTGKIDKGWHVYSHDLGADGPIQATFNVTKLDGVELVGRLTHRGNEVTKYDPQFNMKLRYFENSVQFVQKVRFTKPEYTIDAYLEYGACNDEACMPPMSVDIRKSGKAPAVAGAKTAEKVAEEPEEAFEKVLPLPRLDSLPMEKADSVAVADSAMAINMSAADMQQWWKPITKELKQLGTDTDLASRSLWYIFLMGFVGGLLALVMPCIWPIIPMTVSFFLKRAKDDKARGIRDAAIYGVSIVVIYVGLGLLITGAYGPSKLNELSTNAVFNIVLFVLLVVFALSFFGWFEIKLPDSWANSVDTKATKTTGLLSIFLMAFTLVLVSFSCTAPIIGLLLVETVTSGNWISPLVGMLGFALALALPFTLFALFPSWLKQAPKSGAWMNTIKVVLGFIELAFSLKFLSVADLAYGWHIMDRETFLALWIVIFGAMGFYLVGKLKFQSDAVGGEIDKPMPVPAIMLGLCSLAFAVYMVPGLWGAPCKAVSAFAPPMYTQDFNLRQLSVNKGWNDYETGMAVARKAGKPVLIDFTGFGCVNCRKMEAAVWTDPQVAKILNEKYVLISLYVDDKTSLPEPKEVELQGKKMTLRTVGDKWSYLQAYKFGTNTQPCYVALDNDGRPLTGTYSYKEDVDAYLEFLNGGLDRYHH